MRKIDKTSTMKASRGGIQVARNGSVTKLHGDSANGARV